MKEQKHYISALTIAGSDSGGGAGMQADLKTFSALGVYGTSVITAVTVQNTLGVSLVSDVSPYVVAAQLEAVLSDFSPMAIKIGMVHDSDVLCAIVDVLKKYHPETLIIDPIIMSSSGKTLMSESTIQILKTQLLPLSTLVTPNIPEAQVLAQQTNLSLSEMSQRILAYGSKAVLIKGGHVAGETKSDALFMADNTIPFFFSAPTVVTRNTHGTGCTLSAAIASFMARGETLCEAVRLAKEYVTLALREGSDVVIGKGIGPMNHFFNPQPLIKR